ncbi:MAG: dimethylargininase [Aeromicrobium sp.]
MTIAQAEPLLSARRASTRRHYLMCPPTFFDVSYRINPWMHPDGNVSQPRAMQQWAALRQAFVEAGHVVDVIEPVDGLPDMVFAANGGLVVEGRAVAARFRFQERAAESAAYERWFADAGLTSFGQTSAVNEGEGDLLVVGDMVLAGTGFRTHLEAHAEISALLGRPVVSLDLIDDRYYHLDTALVVLTDEEVAYFPDAFSLRSQALLRDLFPTALLAAASDAAAFGLNAVSDGRRVFLPAGATGLERQLVERGFEPHPIDVSELLKAGGGVKCCTLEIRR